MTAKYRSNDLEADIKMEQPPLNCAIKMEQPHLNYGIKMEQALDLNISSGLKVEQALDLNMSSNLKIEQAMDLNMSSDKVRSLCLAVELCVVCGDRASGKIEKKFFKISKHSMFLKCFI